MMACWPIDYRQAWEKEIDALEISHDRAMIAAILNDLRAIAIVDGLSGLAG